MQFNVLITYRKPNGKTLTRQLSSCDYRVGYVNSYGWEVIEIQVFWNGRYVSLETYRRELHESLKKDKKRRQSLLYRIIKK